MEVKRIKKFEKMVLGVNLLSEKQIFFAVCKEFGDCFSSLLYNKEQWDNIRKFVLGDEKLLPLIQQVLKDKHLSGLRCVSIFDPILDVEIEVKRSTSIHFNHIFKHMEFIIYPSKERQKRMLRINTIIFAEEEVNPEVIIVVDYSKNSSLEHWNRYLNLWNKLANIKGFKGCKRLFYQEEEVFEEN